MEVEDLNSEEIALRCTWGAIFVEMGIRTNQLPISPIRSLSGASLPLWRWQFEDLESSELLKAYVEEHLGWRLSTFLYEAILAMHNQLSGESETGSTLRFKDVWTFQSPSDPNARLGDFIEGNP